MKQILPTITTALYLIHSTSSFSPPILLHRHTHAPLSANNNNNDEPSSESSTVTTAVPSKRAARKAAQRAKKMKSGVGNKRSNAKSNHPQSSNTKAASSSTSHALHSHNVQKLDADTTAEEVVTAIKRAQNTHDLHDAIVIGRFLLEEVDPSYAYGYRGSLLSRLAVASLHLNHVPIAKRCIQERRMHHHSSMLPLESAAIVRGLLRVHCIEEAWEVLEEELGLPMLPSASAVLPTTITSSSLSITYTTTVSSTNKEEDQQQQSIPTQQDSDSTEMQILETKERVIYRARSLCSIISRYLYEEQPTAAIDAIGKLKAMGQIIRELGLDSEDLDVPWEKLVRGAALCESRRRDGVWDTTMATTATTPSPNDSSGNETPNTWPCNLVYPILDAMIAFPSDNNDRTFEALCNALVRRTVFVTGAVSLAGCPKPDRGECAFIGRSNVGKSSLVNMITNRKSLAFTSKTPGKTQQFNYFAVNDKPDLERQIRYGDDVGGSKDLDSFYIVDLPGFGFAKVPQKQRQQWSDFMEEYFLKRSNLKVVFHLIDARHGPTEEDGKIMQKVGNLLDKEKTTYVVVLTKADKNVKGADSEKNPGRVSDRVWEKLLDTMRSNRVGYAPIVLTSANTRLGRDEVWKYLRLAAEV